jgi:hypothetical protein
MTHVNISGALPPTGRSCQGWEATPFTRSSTSRLLLLGTRPRSVALLLRDRLWLLGGRYSGLGAAGAAAAAAVATGCPGLAGGLLPAGVGAGGREGWRLQLCIPGVKVHSRHGKHLVLLLDRCWCVPHCCRPT